MRIRRVLWLATPLLVVVLTACGKPATRGGPYAEAKRGWDTPPSAQTESQLRQRVVTSQRDS